MLAVRKANVIIVIVVGWLGCALAPVGGIGCGGRDDIGCGSGVAIVCVGNWLVCRGLFVDCGGVWVNFTRARREGRMDLLKNWLRS